jgi:hypothetical protein
MPMAAEELQGLIRDYLRWVGDEKHPTLFLYIGDFLFGTFVTRGRAVED